MKRKAILVVAALALSLASVSAAVPIVQIQGPRQVTEGDEITLEIVITHRDNTSDHHINYVWLYQDDRIVQEWVWTVGEFIEDDQFSLFYTTVLEKDAVFIAKAHCTLHGDKKITYKVEVMPYVEKPKAILLANDIDFNRAKTLVEFLEGNGFEVIRITARELEEYKAENLIIILGGVDAPDGVGSIVKEVLDEREQELTRLSARYFVKTDVWAPNQRVFVFAGADRDQTKQAHTDFKDNILT